jgi:predicted ATPase
MIKSVQFKNFKVLRDATLPLSRFTLIVGPNGSGKSTALRGLQVWTDTPSFPVVATVGLPRNGNTDAEIVVHWGPPHEGIMTAMNWTSNNTSSRRHETVGKTTPSDQVMRILNAHLAGVRVYSLDAAVIAAPVQLSPKMELTQNGGNLAGVLDRLRDQAPERFEALNEELGRWFPEFDRVLFDTPATGQRAFLLRTRREHCAIPAVDLSHGTLLALAILTLSHLPNPPSLVGLEEPDRGIHPRLLRQIQDALYRLSYPEDYGEKRAPVQVIATTHSPYLLDLYREYPEEIVIAQKAEDGARFERLSDHPHIVEVLGDAPLGDVWYSGILGGVPAEQ